MFLVCIIYCAFKAIYRMSNNYSFLKYVWRTAKYLLKLGCLKISRTSPAQKNIASDQNTKKKNQLLITSIQSSSIKSLNQQQDKNDKDCDFQWQFFLFYFKTEFCGKTNRSLYSMRSITVQSRLHVYFGIGIYLTTSFFISFAKNINPEESSQLQYLLAFFFETLFVLIFPNFFHIVTCIKEFTFIAYFTRLVGLYFIHIFLIIFELKKIELLLFLYQISAITFFCDPSLVKPMFSTKSFCQNTLEMYHLTFLGKIQGKFMFFYVRRIDEIKFNIVIAIAINQSLKVLKECKLGNKSVHKVYYDHQKKIITLWKKSPDQGIDISLYSVPSLKCLQMTILYKSPAANVYGYANNNNKYCLINKFGHNIHLFEGNVYQTAIPIPDRPCTFDDFYIYETDKCGEIILGVIKSAKNSTEYRVFRIFKDKKVWMVEDEIIFDECITHHILINEEKIIFISASWNIYIYDARTLKRIEILTNQLLPNSMFCQIKYHRDQQLFEIGIQKEKVDFLIPDISKPKILAQMGKQLFNSLFFLNQIPIILSFQKSGQFFKRTVNYSLYDLPKSDKLFCQLTSSSTDFENFYAQLSMQ